MSGSEIFLILMAVLFPVGILLMLWRMRVLAKDAKEEANPVAPGWEDTVEPEERYRISRKK